MTGLSLPRCGHIIPVKSLPTIFVRLPMKHSPFCPSRHQTAVLAVALGLALLAAPKFAGLAHAFTLEGQSNSISDGAAKYADPVDPKSRLDGGGNGTTLQQGNTTFQFGGPGPSSSERFNSDANRMFNPLGRPGQPDR
jgi:hypothetical protein